MMHELSVTTLIDAAPDRVWDVMVNRIAEWWCPAPWRTEVVALERCAGGRCELTMYGPNGEVHANPGTVMAWDERRRFAFTDAVIGDLEPAGPFMIGIFEIAAEGAGTRYTARARHWTQEALVQHRDMGFETGWTAVAAQLKALSEAD